MLDYFLSALIVASPWLFGFAQQPVAPQIAVSLGCALALISLFTDYEAGLVRMIPFPVNLFLDFLVGVVLGGSIIHFAQVNKAGIVFAGCGVLIILNALLTRRPKDTPTS